MFKANISDSRFADFTWYLKDAKLPISDPILKLSASGEELSYIFAYFRGIPTRMQLKEIVWTGVYAQFIYDNL